MATAAAAGRHLRPREGETEQRTTSAELFFDLVYVLAVTQLSHLLLGDLSPGGLGRAGFLLLVVWWAWIYTTWMTNWFDPGSPSVRAVLTGAMLASLVMAAALPLAFGEDGLLFAGAYVTLQVGRNAAAATLLGPDHRLRAVFERLVLWSLAAGALWLGGAALDGDARLLLWGPALALDLAAPAAGYWCPGRGRAATGSYDLDGGHFSERCQLFVLIALGESIAVSGATAASGGLALTGLICLVVAFLQSVALWWLYFGTPATDARAAASASADPGRLARDAYTYGHVLIVGGIVATAAADDLLIAGPGAHLHGVGLLVALGGPVLFLLGTTLFQWMSTGAVNRKRVLAAALIAGLASLAPGAPALALALTGTAVLAGLAIAELPGTTGARSGASVNGAGAATATRRR